MTERVEIIRLIRGSTDYNAAKDQIEKHHYLHCMPDARTSLEVFGVHHEAVPFEPFVGYLVFGRPEATRCGNWYGSVGDVLSCKCEVTRWQVLNLARMYIKPEYQRGGKFCNPSRFVGFYDRHGVWHSTLASQILTRVLELIGKEYLIARPPVFLDEPYEIVYVLSYCNTALHKGTIYHASGFELYRTNSNGIQTWRKRLSPLQENEKSDICNASTRDRRAQLFRAQRAMMEAQMNLFD